MQKYLIAILLFSVFVFFILSKGKEQGKQEEALKNAEEQSKIQNEIIETTKKVIKREQINRSTDIDDDLIWLQNSVCSDCNL